ncbi:hypothetical protein BDQ12DRAFT_768508 [Crucibulum laeve]|uniref:Uncharacterized protein n=1 Tax=Crucibulum laeve TaxID=68775 RepID=A0A5C3LJS9_9AGAR|nr:hypothetical protein BDQ12DRAFT_768508 [Crucibulum laeve]
MHFPPPLPMRFYPEPRRMIMGGFTMSVATAKAWAQREFELFAPREREFDLEPGRDDHTISEIINIKLAPYGTKFKKVGEYEEEMEWMIVTQSAPFSGNTCMDPRLIPQFQESVREELARELLAKEGVAESEYEFKTVLC